MSILEPGTRETTVQAVAPEQRDPAVESLGAPEVVVDHVRSHAAGCYWDVVECRWECSRD